MLIVDTREKWTQSGNCDRHISGYLDRHGIEYVVQKLDVGDYMLDGGSITVDRKQNLEEISRNLTNGTDKQRFWAEVRRAKSCGLSLVVLVETNKIKTLQDLRGWVSKFTPVTGQALIRQMERLRHAYGVRFVFAPRVSSARMILEILEGKA